MQSPTIGCSEIDLFRLGFDGHRYAGENVAAERIIPCGIGIGIVRSITSRGVADDQRRLAVLDVVDSQPQFEPLTNPEDCRDVEVILCPQLCEPRADFIRQIEFGIEGGKLHAT